MWKLFKKRVKNLTLNQVCMYHASGHFVKLAHIIDMIEKYLNATLA